MTSRFTKIPRYQTVEVRFGNKQADGYGSGPVITYRLNDEELEKIRKETGWMPAITKEQYFDLKAQGKSDAQICKEFGIDSNKLYALKKQWNAIGKFRAGKKEDVKPKQKENKANIASSIEANVTTAEVIDLTRVEKAALDIAATTDRHDNPSLFRQITNEIADILERKNHDYGDSFGELYREFGDISSAIRLTDKLKRFRTLINKERLVSDESIEDTLRDIAGYAILTLVEKRKARSSTQ